MSNKRKSPWRFSDLADLGNITSSGMVLAMTLTTMKRSVSNTTYVDEVAAKDYGQENSSRKIRRETLQNDYNVIRK